MPSSPIDILAIAAHRDDVEQTCGGTLLKMAERGYRTGILDLTRGEMGTRGSADERAREALEAGKILKVGWREALDLPDGRIENTWENRLKVARVIRTTRPRVLILPYWKGRHPDHYRAAELGYEAAFVAGLAKLDPELALKSEQTERSPSGSTVVPAADGQASLEPHRPFKIIYATLYYDVRPSFVVDITDQFEQRFEALMAYRSQFAEQETGKEIFPSSEEIRARIESMARFYGMLAGVTYGEPFLQKEVGLIEDLTAIPVQSF